MYNHLKIIFWDSLVWLLKTAFYTFVQNIIFSPFLFHPYRLHHTATLPRPISWKNINVLRPKALWAMVSVTVAFNSDATTIANKVFYFFYKFTRHNIFLPRSELCSTTRVTSKILCCAKKCHVKSTHSQLKNL